MRCASDRTTKTTTLLILRVVCPTMARRLVDPKVRQYHASSRCGAAEKYQYFSCIEDRQCGLEGSGSDGTEW
jgi:hypothetical protein